VTTQLQFIIIIIIIIIIIATYEKVKMQCSNSSYSRYLICNIYSVVKFHRMLWLKWQHGPFILRTA